MSFARDKQRKGISFAVLSGGFSAGEARLTVELYIEGGRPLRERRGGISKVLPPSLPPPPPPPVAFIHRVQWGDRAKCT